MIVEHQAMHGERVEELKHESIPDLLRQLATETTTLVRQEIDLAKVEIVEKGKALGAAGGMFGVAAVFGLGAFGAVTAFLIALIGLALPIWAAALIVAVIYGIVALVMAQRGKKKIEAAAPLAPQQTMQTVKEDVEWAKTRAQSAKR
ncbi:MAG: phage holin family protein [Candidatus Velthaea sp.]